MRRTRMRRRPASCDGKKAMSREEAEQVAWYWRTQRMARMRAYRCRFCHLPGGARAWHIGNG